MDGGKESVYGGAAPAPVEEMLVDFLNTYDAEFDVDEISTVAQLDDWAAVRGLVPGDLAETRTLRDALWRLAAGEPTELPRIPLYVSAAGEMLGLTASTVAEAALSSAVTLGIEGRLGRVRLCRADDCRFAFYDRSRNGSRTWCEMGVCGNRAKARAYRATHG